MTAQTDKQGKKNMEPKIYVACLSAYNNGYLHGAYIDATLEPDEMLVLIGDMLDKSPIIGAEEWAIHDYDDFGHLNLSEVEDLQHIQDVACFLVEHGELGAKLLEEFCGDVNRAKQHMEDNYIGKFDSLRDYVYEMVDEYYYDELPEFIRHHLDYESMERTLSHDLIEIKLNGFVYLYHNT